MIFFVLLWFALGVIVMHYSHWAVRLIGYTLMGILIHGLGNFMHEGIHGNLFRSRRLNRWIGFLAGAPTLLPASAFGANHLLHHKYTRTDRDPDEMMYISDSPWLRTLFFYFWFFFGTIIFGFRVPYVVLTRCTPAERKAAFIERAIMTLALLGIVVAAYHFEFLNGVLHCWVIPLVVASLLGNVRGWAEHQLTIPNHPLTQTRTVTSSRWFSFFNINLNYHLEHHLFPGVPWYNLPRLHRLLLPEYEKAGASVYRSYFRFVWDAFRFGIHGITPDLA